MMKVRMEAQRLWIKMLSLRNDININVIHYISNSIINYLLSLLLPLLPPHLLQHEASSQCYFLLLAHKESKVGFSVFLKGVQEIQSFGLNVKAKLIYLIQHPSKFLQLPLGY